MPEPMPLTEELASFIQGPVSTVLASCDAALQTSVVFARGTRVSPDRSRITVILCASQAQALLADVRASGRVAVNFSLPATNRSVQFKGADARIEPLRPLDIASVNQWTRDFIAGLVAWKELEQSMLQAFLHHDVDDLVAISFHPGDGFLQTPGPGAGARL